jgi:hypothetical protein
MLPFVSDKHVAPDISLNSIRPVPDAKWSRDIPGILGFCISEDLSQAMPPPTPAPEGQPQGLLAVPSISVGLNATISVGPNTGGSHS